MFNTINTYSVSVVLERMSDREREREKHTDTHIYLSSGFGKPNRSCEEVVNILVNNLAEKKSVRKEER